MREIKTIRFLHLILVISLITSSFVFSRSKGLVMRGTEKDRYVTELLSTGSDDNVTIEFSAILFIPVIIIVLFRIKKNMNLFEYLFTNFINLLQIFFLFCIEAGSVFNTIIYKHNKALLVWLVSFIMIICLTQYFYFYCKCNKHHQPQRQKAAE